MLKTKVVTIVGTRPELIRLSRVIAALSEFTNHVLVHTGQNYDHELNQIFFDELSIPAPDHYLGVDTSSLGNMLGGIFIETEKVLLSEKPDAVLILGDTNSAISAIMAKRMKIPVYHMEAGNRCFDPNVPEEINRRLVDRISDFNLVYTEHARRHLLLEGFPQRRIYLTGSPMKEVLSYHRERIGRSNVLKRENLDSKKYFLVSAHREENVDSRERLRTIVETLNVLADTYKFPVIVSTHPRTRSRLDDLDNLEVHENVVFARPFGFLDYNCLQKNAYCVISDSGTISEESSLLSFPAITIRDSIERPESMDTGSIIITGVDCDVILQAIRIVVSHFESGNAPPVPVDYQHNNVSQRVLNLIVGTAHLSASWDGLRSHDCDFTV